MLLKLRRSQRATFIKGTAVFILEARVSLTQEEYNNVGRYRLGEQVIYNSASSRRHLDAADASIDGTGRGLARGLMHSVMARMNLNISVNSIIRGTHVECKDLEELLAAEDAVMTACQNLKGYLDTAATFDGREILVDYDTGKPKIVEAPTPQIAVDRSDIPATIAPSVIDAEYEPTGLAHQPADQSNEPVPSENLIWQDSPQTGESDHDRRRWRGY